MNKHADTLISHLQDAQRSSDSKQSEADKRAEEDSDTLKLVRAIWRGEGLKPDRPTNVNPEGRGSSQGSKRPA